MVEIATIFLRTETELVLKSRRVIPGRLVEAGFQFQFAEWNTAAQNLVGRWRAIDSSKA
jgi:NAD dependent epimerase/dehydratase family enzyme